ncbi:MAG: MCP four helix bundle domain-containing protein, partial [Methylibium sp.]|nr:MCP four helix bundle domain-containing protein [Methylibium sp.]
MNLSHLRVKTKLMLGFALLAAVVLLVSGLSLRSLGNANERFTAYLEGVGNREHLAVDIRGAATRRAIAARNLVLVTLPADRDAEKLAVTQAHEDVQASIAKLKQVVVAASSDATDRDRALLAAIEK